LNLLELAVDLAAGDDGTAQILDDAVLDEVLQQSLRRFDKGGDAFYDQISALHKAVRGSSPDAALYWLCRMLDGGCDPLYLARRVVRMASEDIGNADPRALGLALDAWQVLERLGSPEGELALAQAVVYLAVAPKSNAVYSAFKAAAAAVESGGSAEVPVHLRNAPTALARAEGHGADYRYAHDEPGGYAPGENYFPEALKKARFYHPVDRGLEQRIAERLKRFRALDAASTRKRYGDD
jgi:putative ATPase